MRQPGDGNRRERGGDDAGEGDTELLEPQQMLRAVSTDNEEDTETETLVQVLHTDGVEPPTHVLSAEETAHMRRMALDRSALALGKTERSLDPPPELSDLRGELLRSGPDRPSEPSGARSASAPHQGRLGWIALALALVALGAAIVKELLSL